MNSEEIQILKNRLARGDISTKDYDKISKKLVAEIKINKKTEPSHAGGEIVAEDPSPGQYNIPTEYPQDVVRSWIPRYSMVPYSTGKTPRPLTAAMIQKNRD
jgi:hypothetical protein